MRAKLIRVFWSDPQPIDGVIATIDNDCIGLYYITRRANRDNAKEKSLYLGESTSSIKNRLKDHKGWVHGYSRSEIFVRIGKIDYPKQNIEEAIKHAENALILEHSNILCENTASTKTYTYTDIFKIINEGNRFELKYEVDMNSHEDA